MAGASVKLGVDVTQFKKGMQEATGSVKTLDAQLKTNEAQLKATGDAEVYMTNKIGLLEKQLEAQKQVVANASKALQAMKDQGLTPASAEFQKMEQNLANATGKMFSIKAQLNEVKSGAGNAKTETKNMNAELKNIGKGVAFENITNGLKSVTEHLENGARAAINFGKKIAKSAMDSTGWADDVLTRAIQNNVDAETIQRMDNVSRFIDTDVDTIIAAKNRLANNKKGLGELLGLEGTEGMSLEDQFWAAGDAIMALTNAQERADKAQDVFGRSWQELVPLFAAGREEYEKLMATQEVLTNEQVDQLAKADDEFQKMQIELQRMKNQFWAENSGTIKDLMQWLIDNKGAVKTALAVIAGGFAALKVGELALDIKKVIDGFERIRNLGRGGGDGVTTGGASGAGSPSGTATKAGKLITAKSILAEAGTAMGIDAAVVALAVAPAVLGQTDVENNIKNTYEKIGKVVDAAEEAGMDAERLRRLQGAMVGDINDRNGLGFLNLNDTDKAAAVLMGMSDPRKRGQLYSDIQRYGAGLSAGGDQLWTALLKHWGEYREWQDDDTSNYKNTAGERRVEAPLDPAAVNELVTALAEVETRKQEEQMAKQAQQLSTASEAMETAAGKLDALPGRVAAAVEGANITVVVRAEEHANGLFSVPWDGYPAILHKGERVMTARENQRYTTNNYFGNVNLNNGLEIEALTESIDRRNRRQMAGFGAA